MQGQNFRAIAGGGCGGFQHFSGLGMQFAASPVGQSGVRDLPKKGVPKAQMGIRGHNEAFQPGKQFGHRLLWCNVPDHA